MLTWTQKLNKTNKYNNTQEQQPTQITQFKSEHLLKGKTKQRAHFGKNVFFPATDQQYFLRGLVILRRDGEPFFFIRNDNNNKIATTTNKQILH